MRGQTKVCRNDRYFPQKPFIRTDGLLIRFSEGSRSGGGLDFMDTVRMLA
jgi:hypothetical protein